MTPRWDGTRPTLAERSGRPEGGPDPHTSTSPTGRRPVSTRHCWVTGLPNLPGRHAGLLIEWRRGHDQQWLARVVYAVMENESPVVIEAWIVATHLTPVP